MEIHEIIEQLKDKFGDKIDVSNITEHLKGIDTSNLSFQEIVGKLKGGVGKAEHAGSSLLGDLDGDGKVESAFDEIKGKAASLFGKI